MQKYGLILEEAICKLIEKKIDLIMNTVLEAV